MGHKMGLRLFCPAANPLARCRMNRHEVAAEIKTRIKIEIKTKLKPPEIMAENCYHPSIEGAQRGKIGG